MKISLRRFMPVAATLLALFCTAPAFAGLIHRSAASSFNGGHFQLNTNFTGIGGDYPLINLFKNTSGSWTWADNNGTPSPSDLDQNGYPINGSTSIVSHGGVKAVVRIPAQNYIRNNCPVGSNGSGICFSFLVNGVGTIIDPGIPINSSSSVAIVTTGSTTTVSFSAAQDFKAGMEVPISGTTGVTATNGGGGSLTAGGSSGAWTVCAANLTTTQIQLCLNDQVTPLQTTGAAGGTTVVTYGRNAVGVSSKGRVVSAVSGSPVSVNAGISTQDATTPITYRNGVDGLVMIIEGSEETRYSLGQTFGAKFLSVLQTAFPGVIRGLDYLNTNVAADVLWADRMPVGYFSYGSDQYARRSSSTLAGTTTSLGVDFSATLGSGSPSDGQQVILSFDAASVTVANGANAPVTWTGHGLSLGQPVYLGFTLGGSLPGGITGPFLGASASSYTYYAITNCGSCNTNTIQLATTYANAIAGTAVTTSSTGSNVVAHATVAPVNVTLTSGNSNIAWPNHGLSTGNPVSFNCNLNYPLNTEVSYFVKTVVDPNTITTSATNGGTVLTPLTSGSCQGVRDPTLNLNSSGAIAIHGTLGTGVGTTRNEQPVAYNTGQQIYASLTYDAVLNIWVKKGGDTSFGTSYFTSGWPPEVFLSLAQQIGAHPWFSPLQFTVDSSAGITDYNTNLYHYVRLTAPSWMIPRFETIPNEFWNNQFPSTVLQAGHAVVYAATAGWSQNSGVNQIAGKIASVLGQAVHNEYGGTIDSTKYETTVGVQSFNFSQASGATTNAPRLTSADYVAQSTAPQSPYLKSAAFNWMSHVACAQYFTPGYKGTSEGTILANANAGGVITGSIAAGTSTLNVSSVRVVTSPVFGIGSILTSGPGIVGPVTVTGGSAPNWTLDTTFPNGVGSTNIDYLASGYDTTAAQTYIDSSLYDGTATATITGTSMVVTGATGFIFASSGNGGDFIYGAGVQPYTQVISAPGGNQNGTYTITPSQNVGPISIQASSVFGLPSENIIYQNVFSFAQTYTNRDGFLLRMNGYEGGYSPDYNSAGLSLADQLSAQGKLTISSPGSATGIYGYVLTNCQNFKAAGGEFCSLFQFTGISPSNNAWSALEDIYQPAQTPIWNAYKDFH